MRIYENEKEVELGGDFAYDKVYFNEIDMKLSKNSHGVNEVKIDLNKINLRGAISSAIPSNNSYSSLSLITKK
jgi:hypothetical protein